MNASMTFDQLAGVVQGRLAELTPSQRRLAEHVLRDPGVVAFMSVRELADVAGVNSSTVVRFAHALGLDGYPALQEICRGRLRSEAQMLARLTTLEEFTAAAGDPLETAAQLDRASIARSVASIDRDAWARAVALLSEAPAVQVIGLRQSYAPAYLLRYLLGLVREGVDDLGSDTGLRVERLRSLTPADCVVAVSIHPYTREVVDAVRWVHRRGVSVIGLTDTPASPLAAVATAAFFVETAGVSVLQSVTAATSVVQALVTATAAARGPRTRALLENEDELLDAFNVYWHDDAP